MSLTLHWNGRTYPFEAPDDARGSEHHDAYVDKRLHKNVHLIRSGMLGGKPTRQLVLKIGYDDEDIAALEKEAKLYRDQLKPLQGKHIPFFFGIFHGQVEDQDAACILLEYCAGGGQMTYPEMNRQIMLAACAIHAVGLMHCALLHRPQHLILSGKSVKIVDFSHAEPHRCVGATPTLYPGMGGDATGCLELVGLEACYGVFSGERIPEARPSRPPSRAADGGPLQVLARRVGGYMTFQ
ncbi:hypothetical protein GGX14DRAFT_656371 [Mycena pura]|uniref:Protein kinase domain-containing protein n=1 Tax=Mycena pura TaxID=153505 RepID=A0AAD6V2J8_9AGAR|nr:hypothetical protein GGX14DRAFT_656371 [Mycena pura]